MLLDTSGLLCLFDADEKFHESAHANYAAGANRLTHSYVIAEFIPLVRSRNLSPPRALSFLMDILTDPEVEIVWVDRDLNNRALDVLVARADKKYSLCDAVSFILMRRENITEALTTDRHFEQEGFSRLLK